MPVNILIGYKLCFYRNVTNIFSNHILKQLIVLYLINEHECKPVILCGDYNTSFEIKNGSN